MREGLTSAVAAGLAMCFVAAGQVSAITVHTTDFIADAAALPLADRAVKLAPKNRHVRHTRGVILAGLPGRLTDARTELEACLALCAADILKALPAKAAPDESTNKQP